MQELGTSPDRDNLVALAHLGCGSSAIVRGRRRTSPAAGAAAKLGEETPVAARTKLKRVRFAKHGIEVLATDTILAICLTTAKAPAIPVQPVGGGPAVGELKVCMDDEKCAKILADEAFDFRNLDDPGVSYRFYSRLGLGVRVKDRKVVEIIVAQIPRQPRERDD